MASFTNISKSSHFTPTIQSKDTDTWSNLLHSDIYAAGFDQQAFDSTEVGFDTAGNTISTSWTITNKETG